MRTIRCSLVVSLLFWPSVASQLRTTSNDPSKEYEGEIYNGEPASEGEFPAFALLCFDGAQQCGGCGGFLVDGQYVLTAAHCVVDSSVTGVRIGARRSRTDGLYSRVIQVIVHPDFYTREEPFEVANDVALLKLSGVVTGVTPFPINRDASLSGQQFFLTAIGFGIYDQAGNSLSNYLRKTSVSSFTDYRCSLEAEAGGGVHLADQMMCTKGRDTGGCRGDSGGPVLNSEGVVLGVLSFGEFDCTADSFDFWADLWYYAGWIQAQLPSASPTLTPRPIPTPAPASRPSLAEPASPTCYYFGGVDTFWGRTTNKLFQWFGVADEGGGFD
jgi:trypsin